MNADELPPIDKEIDYLFVTTNWLIETRNSPSSDPREIRAKFLNQLREQSDSCRHSQCQVHLNIPYGDCVDQKPKSEHSGEDAFDWFGPSNLAPNRSPKVIVVYIHGGYWQAVELAEASHWANSVTNAGAIFVALSFRLAPWQNIKSMPRQLSIGMQKIFQYTLDQLRLGHETDSIPDLEICLVGHSAGVQLALEMLQVASTDNSSQFNWFNNVKYLILISGVYDLRPLLHTSINQALGLRTVEEAWALSPLRNFADPPPKWITKPMHWFIVWAQYDSPALIEQSQQIVDRLTKLIGSRDNSAIETFEVVGTDHFTSIGELYEGPDQSKLMRKILEFVGLID